MTSCVIDLIDKYKLTKNEIYRMLERCESKCGHYSYCKNIAVIQDRLKELEV